MNKALVNIPYGKILLILLASILINSRVYAAAVTNMDDKEHMIEVRINAGYEPQIIKPGETWRTNNAVTVKFGSTETWIDSNQEFAIWKGGVFGPQKTNTNDRGKP